MKNLNTNPGYALFHYFDDKRTPECDKYYDYITDLVLTEAGEIDTIREPLFSKIKQHISDCKFCENCYYITRNVMPDQPAADRHRDDDFDSLIKDKSVPSAAVIAAMHFNSTGIFERPLTGHSGGMEPLGEIEITIKDLKNNLFRLKLFFDADSQFFYCDIKSKNRLKQYQVIYQDNGGEIYKLFDHTEGGEIEAGMWSGKILVRIDKDRFRFENINKQGFQDSIYIVENAG